MRTDWIGHAGTSARPLAGHTYVYVPNRACTRPVRLGRTTTGGIQLSCHFRLECSRDRSVAALPVAFVLDSAGVPSTPWVGPSGIAYYCAREQTSGGSSRTGVAGSGHATDQRARPGHDGSMAMPLQAARCKWMMMQVVPTEERDPVWPVPCALNSHVVFFLYQRCMWFKKCHGNCSFN